MSALTETSLTSMKAAFPTVLKPIYGFLMLASLINLMLHKKTPTSATMNMMFLAASPDLYSYFMNKAYPSSHLPFPKEVDDVPDFSMRTSDNKCKSLKATHARNQNTLEQTWSRCIWPALMFSLHIFQKQFARHTS
jgi:hypothetical protein